MMDLTVCLVGNSSSAIREGSFLGTPAVNVGTRQSGREHGDNVLFADNSIDSIRNAINIQLEHGKYSENRLYGDGNAGTEIAEILAKLPKLSTQKRLNFN
jgi:UDP-N-acetylglucosamine 2-epimerase